MAELVAQPFVFSIAKRDMPVSLICLSQGLLPIRLGWCDLAELVALPLLFSIAKNDMPVPLIILS